MSRPKELNFFVAELNWELGAGVVREPLRPRRRGPRRDLAPLHQPAPLRGRRRADARAARRPTPGIVYMVRDPIDRMLSHYLHNVGGGYETRPLEAALADPGLRLRRPQPLRDAARALPARPSARERVLIVSREELRDERAATMRRVFEFCGRRRRRSRSPQFEREWETGERQAGGRLPAHGPGRAAARAAGARPQLRPAARIAALAGRADRPRPGRRRGAETADLRLPARHAAAPVSRTTRRAWRTIAGRKFGWI